MRSKYLNITVQTMDVRLSEITVKDCPYIASKLDKEITKEELGNAVDVIIAYLYQQNKDGLLVDLHGRDDYLAENDTARYEIMKKELDIIKTKNF